MCAHQARELRTTGAAGVAQIGQHHPAFALGAPGVVKAPQYPADVGITLRIVAVRRKPDLGIGAETLLELRDCGQSRVVHVDHHPEDDQPARYPTPNLPSGSFLVGQGCRKQWNPLTATLRHHACQGDLGVCATAAQVAPAAQGWVDESAQPRASLTWS